jgi:hypothetical protein
MGALRVFDYNSLTVVHDIIADMKGKTTAGAVAIGVTAANALFDISTSAKEAINSSQWPATPSRRSCRDSLERHIQSCTFCGR